MKIKKSVVSIGKVNFMVIQFNYTPPEDKDITAARNHFIELLKKNEAMSDEINTLIDEVKKAKSLVHAKNVVYECLPNFREKFEALEGVSHENITINCEGKSIVKLTQKDLRLESDNYSANLSKSINKFYILSSKVEDFEFKINNETYNSLDIKAGLTTFDISNLLYSLAYKEYSYGNSAKALDILSISLKDKYLSKLILNSFTSNERENCKEILLKASHNKKIKLESKNRTNSRMIEGIMKENELFEKGPCFIDLLKVFEQNKDRFIPVESRKYKRIGEKIVDNYNVFKIDSKAEITAHFGSLVFSKEKLNISIRYEIPGVVTINPKQAKAAGFNSNIFSAKIFREQTIIKDGNINIDKFKLLASKATIEYLKSLKIKGLITFLIKKDYDDDIYTLIQLNISKLPVIKRNYILENDSLDYILDTYYEQKVAECRQKIIKFFIKKVAYNIEVKESKYSKEQIELLKSYGLDSKGIYSGVDNIVLKEVQDEYEYRLFEFGIKHLSILPKVENVLLKIRNRENKLNFTEIIMKEYIEYLKENHIDSSFEKLNKLLEEQKDIIMKNTRSLAEIKLYKTLTGGWWNKLNLDSYGRYLYKKDEKILVIKLFRKKIKI